MKKSIHIVSLCILISALLLFATACTTNHNAPTPTPQTTVVPSPETILSPSPAQGDQMGATVTATLDEAKQTALTHAGVSSDEATFLEAKSDYEDGIQVYEIEFVAQGNRYEVEIDATTGAVRQYEVEPVDQLPAQMPQGIISADEAKSIALNDAGAQDAVFTQIELDRDDGRYYFEIDFVHNGQKYGYEIDAQSGTIVEREIHALKI